MKGAGTYISDFMSTMTFPDCGGQTVPPSTRLDLAPDLDPLLRAVVRPYRDHLVERPDLRVPVARHLRVLHPAADLLGERLVIVGHLAGAEVVGPELVDHRTLLLGVMRRLLTRSVDVNRRTVAQIPFISVIPANAGIHLSEVHGQLMEGEESLASPPGSAGED